jgi:integrase
MNSTRKPQTFRRGSVAVKLYTVNNRSGGGTYRQFVLAYRNTEGRRETRKFSDLAVAQKEAELTAAKLASGEADVLTLSSVERAQYLRAKPLLDSAGVPLLAAVEDYTAARRLLPEGVTLLAAVETYRNRHSAGDRSLTVADAVKKYLADRRGAGCSEAHLANLEIRLGRLAAAFQMPLVDLTIQQMRLFLDNQRNDARGGGAELAAQTRRSNLKTMRAFIAHAVRQRWLSKDWNEDMAAISMPGNDHGPILVFTPDEIARLLRAAQEVAPELLPYLAVGAFAGLRAAEMNRLDWAHVDFEMGHVEVPAKAAKVKGRRRLVPMSDNLRAWLTPVATEQGKLTPLPTRLQKLFRKVTGKAGVPWKRNALRHSFISYRCAVTKNVAQVSYEAGNSPAIIHTHYLNCRPEREALAWFAVVPAVGPKESVGETSFAS